MSPLSVLLRLNSNLSPVNMESDDLTSAITTLVMQIDKVVNKVVVILGERHRH